MSDKRELVTFNTLLKFNHHAFHWFVQFLTCNGVIIAIMNTMQDSINARERPPDPFLQFASREGDRAQ